MNFSGLQTFLTIVQTKNLTKASEILHATPSTVSYRLKILEQELGVELVERSKGASQVRLTPSGENFVKLAERWYLLWQETKMFSKSGTQVSVNISAPASLNADFFVPLYQALYQHEPRIRFRVHTQHTEEAIESVARREMDIAFIGRQVSVPAMLTVSPFIEEEMVLLRPAHPDHCAEHVDVAVLDPEYELYWNWGVEYQRWHDQHWDPTYPRRVQVDTAHLIPALMIDRRQWAVVVKSLALLFARSERFTVQKLVNPPGSRVYFIVKHKRPSLSTSRGLDVLDHYLKLLYEGREIARADLAGDA
jgi:LysR family transcriptional regulator, transcriptional activator of the cysJI operon